MVSRLRGIVLLVRDVESAAQFYTGGLGLSVLHRVQGAPCVELVSEPERTK
jgi:catechol 2,3-dioxygenase-like lactoylglutathione lyase family enzyme